MVTNQVVITEKSAGPSFRSEAQSYLRYQVDLADKEVIEGVDAPTSTNDKILESAYRCLSKFGYSKTSMDDIAKEGRCSRATLYRLFPNGKDQIIAEVVAVNTEIAFNKLKLVVQESKSLREAVILSVECAIGILEKNEALQTVVVFDPEYILPFLAFEKMDQIFKKIAELGSPLFDLWLSKSNSMKLAEWLARIIFAYFGSTSEQLKLNQTKALEEFIDKFVMPGIKVMAEDSEISS